MKLRTTIILLALAAGIFVYLKYGDSRLLPPVRKGEFLDPESVERNRVTGVTIRNSEGTIELVGNNQNWRIVSPVKDSVELLTLTTLFTTLEGLSGREVKDLKDIKEKHKEFGVAKGEFSIKLQGQKPVEILVGKDHATDKKVYARVEGQDAVYVIGNQLRNDLAQNVKAWRNRRLMDVNANEVGRITLQTAKGEVELEHQGPNWAFTKPFKARGDNERINDLIATISTAQVEDFITDTKEAGTFGLTEPRATLTLLAVGHPEPIVLQIGALKPAKVAAEEKPEEAPPAPPGPNIPKALLPLKKKAPAKTHLYAKLSTRDGVLTVPAELEKLVNLQPNDLRDKSIVRVQPDIVDRITIESAKGKLVLGRKAEDWVRKIEGKPDEAINSAGANQLLNNLIQAKIVRPVADMAGGDLKGFGLDKPQVSVTLSSYSTEGTPEEAPGDKPIVKLMLGKFEGDAGYAKLDDEPFIVAVPASLLEAIWTDPLQWQLLRVLSLEKDDVVEVEIIRRDFPPATFLHDKVKGWVAAKGDVAVNQITAQSLVNTIADLRAVRWIGPTDTVKHGLDNPELVVRYKLANKKSGKITVGSITPEGMWHATAEGKTGTFIMTTPDVLALSASLLDTPKPPGAISPAPAPGAVIPGKTPTLPAPGTPVVPPANPGGTPGEMPPVPPPVVPNPPRAPEPPKPTEATPGSTKPAPESGPKAQ